MRRLLLTTAVLTAFAVPALLPAPVMAQEAEAAAQSQDARILAFFEAAFQEQISRSPQQMTALGIKRDYDRLNDHTEAFAEEGLALAERQLEQMRASFDYDALNHQNQLSWRLFEHQVAQQRAAFPFRGHRYVFSGGNAASNLPVFMINSHRVDSVQDARDYVARLIDAERVANEVSGSALAGAEAGIVPPAFVFEPNIGDTRNIISGAPFDDGPDNPVWADFQAKVGALDASDAEKAELLDAGRAALTGPWLRGFQRVLSTLETLQAEADSNDGVWRLPDGEAYYAQRVAASTTTDMTPAEIHRLGLEEVARIQGEMERIKEAVGFEGSLQDFFAFIKTDPRFQFPNTAEGREAYLAQARAHIADAMRVAPGLFHTLPSAQLEVRAVEEWRQATAGVAFYNRPVPDGSRPGIYYVNLSDMTQVLRPQIEAISYHEGAPGHHFQIAAAQELEGVPSFRRFGGYGVYSEGWGLYSEWLGLEMGFYEDPYSDFGRLSLELWRAVRLVTDTGLHAMRWSREDAIEYFQRNSLLSERDIVKEVERYLTNPGQAVSYKIGQLKILELRRRAEAALGDRFDVRDFHQVVLSDGAVPLDVLEANVDAWIAGGGGRL